MSEWKEVTVSDNEIWDKTKPIQGIYKKRQSGVGPNESMMYTLKTKDGDVSVWGSTVLDTKFEEIELGAEVRIEPLGEVKSPTTQRKYQDFKVMYKPSEPIEAGKDKVVEVNEDEELDLNDVFPE